MALQDNCKMQEVTLAYKIKQNRLFMKPPFALVAAWFIGYIKCFYYFIYELQQQLEFTETTGLCVVHEIPTSLQVFIF